MTLTAALIGFAGIAFLITIIPATDTALVLRSLATAGPRAAYACVFGISTGLLIWGLAAATGLAVLMKAVPSIFEFITLAGGAYLIYLGIKFLLNLRGWNKTTHLEVEPTLTSENQNSGRRGASASGMGTYFRQGFVANILNPKIAVFYIATVPPFMVASVPPFLMGTLLAAVHGGINILWFAVIISLAKLAMKWLLRPKASLVIDGIAGAVLTVFGALIIIEALQKLL